MIDRSRDIDVEETCARLRKLLVETRGLGRREFIKALGQTLGGSALLSLLPRVRARRRGGGAAGHRFRVRRRVEEIGHGRVRRAVHQEDRHPGRLPGPLHVREAARHARGQGHAGRRGLGTGWGDVPGQTHEHAHAARFRRHRPLGAGRAAIASRQCDRRAHAVPRHLLQQEEMAGRALPQILGGFLGRAKVSRPPRAAPRGGLGDRGGAQGRRRERGRILSDRRRPGVPQPRPHQAPHQGMVLRQLAGPAADGAGGSRSHRHDEWTRDRVHPQCQGAVRDRLERSDLRGRHPGLDRADGMSQSEGRDEVSRHRRARGIPGGVRPPDVLRAAKSQGSGPARARHRQADADLSRERDDSRTSSISSGGPTICR